MDKIELLTYQYNLGTKIAACQIKIGKSEDGFIVDVN